MEVCNGLIALSRMSWGGSGNAPRLQIRTVFVPSPPGGGAKAKSNEVRLHRKEAYFVHSRPWPVVEQGVYRVCLVQLFSDQLF
jgi:hypothetical protein